MGWKGTIRSIKAAYREAERDARHRQRELQQRHKEVEKMQAHEQAAYEVEVYNNRIDMILSMHKQCSSFVNWHAIQTVPEPIKPTRCCYAEEGARARESEYVPGLIDRIIGRGAKKRKLLCDDVLTAIDADEKEYTRSLSEWELAHKDWSDSITWANRVLSRDAQAKIDVIRELNPFSDISDLGSQLTFTVGKTAILEATLHVRGTAAIPKESKSLLSNGKLSVKKIPVSEFYEIYQDYVCSCVLRVSREVFAILPDDIVIVTASDDLLNTATGHKEELPILSVAVSRETIKNLDMASIDPSDCMKNFVYRMNFKKTCGFSAVERLTFNDISRSNANDRLTG